MQFRRTQGSGGGNQIICNCNFKHVSFVCLLVQIEPTLLHPDIMGRKALGLHGLSSTFKTGFLGTTNNVHAHMIYTP